MPPPSDSRDNVSCVGAIAMHVSFAGVPAVPTMLIGGDDILHFQCTLGAAQYCRFEHACERTHDVQLAWSGRNGNWVGGTKEIECARICEHFGCAVAQSHHELVHGCGPITVKALLKNPEFFKTKAQYMLEVHMHVVYVRSNGTKKAMCVCDQRGKQMRFVNSQGEPDVLLEPLLRQRVVSLVLVTPPKR